MGYAGVKFKTEFLLPGLLDDPRLDELIHWCNVFDKRGMAPPYEGGSFGNLSFRLNPGESSLFITASKSGLGESNSISRFVIVSHVDLENRIVYALSPSGREPSSEAMLHYTIYSARSDVNAIFHGHCKEISSNVQRLGIMETRAEAPYGTPELNTRVLEVLEQNDFLEMKNHGFLSLGKELDDAGNLALQQLERCS
jgi:L-fuculose-phosphate aldolase